MGLHLRVKKLWLNWAHSYNIIYEIKSFGQIEPIDNIYESKRFGRIEPIATSQKVLVEPIATSQNIFLSLAVKNVHRF